ncbi:MAG: endonuclease MutS2 [Treponema sp.]
MNSRTLAVLEFQRIAQMIAGYCVSEEGYTACKTKEPVSSRPDAAAAKVLGAAFLAFLHTDSEPKLKNLPPLQSVLEKLHTAGLCLSIEELYAAGLLAEQVRQLHLWRLSKKEENPLCRFIAAIPDLQPVADAVFSCIDLSGELKDIPSLAAARRKIRHIEADIEKIMKSYCTDEQTRSLLQNPAPVLRNGRQVISVQSRFKGRIQGIIHEYSQSGQSFYLEPEAVVLKNNELVKAEAEYQQELHRLLCEMSTKVAAERDTLIQAHQAVIEIDCTAAAARWAKAQNAVFAEEPADGQSFILHQVRHPLLGDAAIPIDLSLSAEDTMLIITGPNTGGKTVSLKTAALCVLLNQTGWAVPAGEQTRLPFFTSVYCAIGDEQSLDNALSTFSASMQTIAGILTEADGDSLILLDELGSGTEPQEGGALAMAVLDELLQRHSRVFVTSHHSVLKNYGYSKKGCVNASVSFEADTLRPSYRIVMGIPGQSHAIDIAAQNGMPPAIIESARNYVKDKSADAAALIQGLIEKHQRLAASEKEQEAAEQRLKEKQRKCDLQALQLKQKELTLRRHGYKRLEQLFEEKRSSIENLVRTIREGALTHEKTAALKTFFSEFEQELTQEQQLIAEEEQSLTAVRQDTFTEPVIAPESLQEGMEVFIPHLHRRGTIIRKEKNNWLVAIDTFKMAFPAEKLEPLSPQSVPNTSAMLSTPQILVEAELHQQSRPEFELRLLGMRLAEAEAALQKQLDLAVMHNLQEFSIIHGKGNGILQTMVQEKLANTSFVAEFSFARPEHGGSGKTIVKLR